MIERLNREIRRRTRVVGNFPDSQSALMLITVRIRYVTSNPWSPRRYLDMFRLTRHVETVCLLSHQKVEHVYIPFEPKAKNMRGLERTTYKEIREWIEREKGLKVSQLYIAQVKAEYGLIERENYNKSKKGDEQRVPTCPPEKHDAIVEAFRHFRMIDEPADMPKA